MNGSGGLQVIESSVIFDGTTGTTPAAGAGTRLMWIPATGAFRAGAVAGVEWDGTDEQGVAVSGDIYFARLHTDESQWVRKMTMVK